MYSEVVRSHAQAAPDRVMVEDGRDRLTRADFDRSARAMAAWLLAQGVQPGDHVGICAHNSARWLVANVGIDAAGCVAVLMTYRATPADLAHLVEDSDSVAVFVDGETARTLAAVAATPPSLTCVVDLDDDGQWAEVVGAEPIAEPLPGGSGMGYTSGTTGPPKGVHRAHGAAAGARGPSMISLFDLQEDDVHLACGPLYHGGPHGFAMMSLAVGARVVVTPRFDPAEALRLIEAERVTSMFLVPTMIRLLTKHPDAQARRYDLSSLRVLVTAGEPCPLPLKRDVADLLGPVLYEFFGASELGVNAVMRPDEHERKPGSCGRIVEGQDLRIVGDDGSVLGPGEEGEIFIRNAALPQYWKRPEDTAAAMREGYMTLGDTGYVDADGYLIITGRKVDLIKSGGVKITPAEIEGVLLDHPGVLEAAVIGVPDPVWTERVVACVLPVPGSSAVEEAELLACCRDRLAGHKVPKQVVLFSPEDWPRLENGKVPKRLLRAAVRVME